MDGISRSGGAGLAGTDIRRGDVLIVALGGDYGKPRPAIVIQSDLYTHLGSVVVCPATTDLRNDAGQLRIDVGPTPGNGLRLPSQLMVDKLSVVSKGRIGQVIGHMENDVMSVLSATISTFLGL